MDAEAMKLEVSVTETATILDWISTRTPSRALLRLQIFMATVGMDPRVMLRSLLMVYLALRCLDAE